MTNFHLESDLLKEGNSFFYSRSVQRRSKHWLLCLHKLTRSQLFQLENTSDGLLWKLTIYFKFSTPKCNQELLYQVWKCFFVYRASVPSRDTAYVQSCGWNRSRVRVQPQCKRNLRSDYGLITLTHVIFITFLAQSFMDSWQSAKRDAGTEGKLRRWTRQSSSGKIMWPIRLFLLKFIPGPLLKIRQSKTRLHVA